MLCGQLKPSPRPNATAAAVGEGGTLALWLFTPPLAWCKSPAAHPLAPARPRNRRPTAEALPGGHTDTSLLLCLRVCAHTHTHTHTHTQQGGPPLVCENVERGGPGILTGISGGHRPRTSGRIGLSRTSVRAQLGAHDLSVLFTHLFLWVMPSHQMIIKMSAPVASH